MKLEDIYQFFENPPLTYLCQELDMNSNESGHAELDTDQILDSTMRSFTLNDPCTEKVSSKTKTPNAKRMSISLSADAANMLEFLAKSQGISQNEALRKAIATEAYLLKERMQGTKVLLQHPDKEVREVLFR